MVDGMAGVEYGMIWIDVEINPSPGCSWASSSFDSNCNFLIELINALSSRGRTPGVYTS